jgi:Ni/Fe-hydrogenase subunit HybB-like protein
MDMETLSSMFAFGIIITFGLFVVGCAAGSNIMPGMVVFIMLGMFVLSRALK